MKVVVAKEAQKQYKRLTKSAQLKIKKNVSTLANNPFAGKKLGGELIGKYTLRAWPYRIIYTIDLERQEVIVKSILHRQGAYK